MSKPVIYRDCPHCSAGGARFDLAGFNIVAREPHLYSTPPVERDGFTIYNTFWTCAKCLRGIVMIMQALRRTGYLARPVDVEFDVAGYKILESHPQPPSLPPEHIPPDIAELLMQSRSCFSQKMFLPCALTLRTVMDCITVRFGHDGHAPLAKRIADMRARGEIPNDMAGWANEIRIIGNNAAHRTAEPVTEQDAADMLQLVGYFLVYLYTLPGLRSRRRETREGGA
jgi:hypothetical protein